MDHSDLRQHILELAPHGQRYAVVDSGWRYLAAGGDDGDVAALVMDGLIDFGLGGPARELLHFRPQLARHPAHAQWLGRLQECPNGRVPWTAQQAIYQHNLAVLLARHGHLSDAAAPLEQAVRGVHLYRTRDGHDLLSCRPAGQPRLWLPGIGDYSAEREVQVPKLAHGTPVFIAALTPGPLVENVYGQTAEVCLNQSLALFIVELDWMFMAAWLHLQDRTAVLSDPRVYVFCGPQAIADAQQFIEHHPDLATAPACIITHGARPSLKHSIELMQQRVMQHRQRHAAELRGRLQHRYAGRDLAYWYHRLQKPGSVLGVTSRATTMLQYSMRDIGQAFTQLGYDFHLLIEEEAHRPITSLQLMDLLARIDPLLVVLIDHLRYEQNHFHNIPMLSWIQDPLPNLFCRQAGSSIGPLDFACGYFGDQCVAEYGYPRERFLDTVLPVSEMIFNDTAVDDAEHRRYQCDLMYVGHLSYTMDQCRRDWKARQPAAAHALLDRIHGEIVGMLQNGIHIGTDHEQLVQRISSQLGLALEPEQLAVIANYYAYRLFDIGFRHQTLSWAGQYARRRGRCLKIYGRGWSEHPTLKQFAAGPVEHGEDLRRAYHGARLVIQTIPSGFQHQRTYEALCSGSLVLSRFSPRDFYLSHDPRNYDYLSPDEFFRLRDAGATVGGSAAVFPDLPEVLFSNAEQFELLAEQFLAYEQHRQSVCRKFRRVVLDRYTYTVVVRDVMQWIQGLTREPNTVCEGACR